MKQVTQFIAFGAAALALGASSVAEAQMKRITIGSNKQGPVNNA